MSPRPTHDSRTRRRCRRGAALRNPRAHRRDEVCHVPATVRRRARRLRAVSRPASAQARHGAGARRYAPSQAGSAPWASTARPSPLGRAEPRTVSPTGEPVAFEHDGTFKWRGTASLKTPFSGDSLALADLDADGDVEILGGNNVFDHQGNLLWTAGVTAANYSATTAADLDGDGKLEVVMGRAAYHHDGSLYYMSIVDPGFPQVANLDADAHPEIERGLELH